jgi:uncharacterized membrane protein
MRRVLDLQTLFLLNAAMLITHEIDSAYWKWRELFGLPGGLQLFLVLNLVSFDLGLLWWNLFLLFFVALMLFPTAVLSEHIGASLAVAVYALCLAGLGLAKAGWWRHAVRRNLVTKGSAEGSRIGRRVRATPLTTLAIAFAALEGVPFAYVGFMVTPLVAGALQRRRGAT